MPKEEQDINIVYKSNTLNVAQFQNFTLNTYQVFMHLITKVQGYKTYQTTLSNTFYKSRKYSLTAQEFKNIFNVNIHVCYKILKLSVDKLLKTQLIIEQANKIRKINICSYADYIKSEGRIDIEFTDVIIPYLLMVKDNFMTYNLRHIADFKSLHTVRLYELIVQYKSTGWILISVEDLRKIFDVRNKLQKYFDFKIKTFKRGICEINKKFHLNLMFEEIKEKNKIVKIRFIFNPIKADLSKFILPSRAQLTDKEAKAKIRLEDKRKAKRLADALAKGILPGKKKIKAISSADDKDSADAMPRKIGDIIDNMIEKNK